MVLVTERPHLDLDQFGSVLPPGQFPHGEQQDCADFIRYMLSILGGPSQGLVRRSFAGELNEVTRCTKCGHVGVLDRGVEEVRLL